MLADHEAICIKISSGLQENCKEKHTRLTYEEYIGFETQSEQLCRSPYSALS